MIKLTPKTVGTRVVLSDGTVHFVTDMTDTHYWLTEAGVPDESLILKLDGLDEDDPPMTLLLDAPNPLDVPVPEWCEEVMLWDGDTCIRYAFAWVIRSKFFDGFFYDGWSPAPGQMPPREAADDGE